MFAGPPGFLTPGRVAEATRQAGARVFISVHVLVPGRWTVKEGHDLVEGIEAEMRAALPHAHVLTHLEPIEDPLSQQDQDLDR